MPNTIVEVSIIVTDIFLSVGVIISAFQLIMKKSNMLQSKNSMADHERRKKQSILDFTQIFILI